VTENTERVYGQRQLVLLRNLAAGTADARTLDEANAMAAACLSRDPSDLPFTVLYLGEPNGDCVLAGVSGAASGQVLPKRVPANDSSSWLAGAAKTKSSVVVEIPASLELTSATRVWPHQALVVPIFYLAKPVNFDKLEEILRNTQMVPAVSAHNDGIEGS
jgi:hypothetical protein